MRTAILLFLAAGVALAAECPPAPASRQEAQAKLQALAGAAGAAFSHGDFGQASERFRQALCFAPESAQLYHGLGLAEAAGGRFAEASQALAQADRLSPHDFTILLPRAQVAASARDFELSARLLRETDRLEGAGSAAGRGATAELHGELGRAFLEQRKLPQALAELLRARKAGREDIPTLLILATLENNLGAYGDAIRDAALIDGMAGATSGQRATAAAVAGLAYKNQKNDADAIRLLSRSLELAPGEPAALALAEIYESGDRTADALKMLERMAAVLPGSQRIALALGRNLAEAGENQRAAGVLAAVTEKAPQEGEAWHWLAQALASLGEFRKSTAALEQLARIQAGYPMIDLMVAQALLKQEPPDSEQALEWLDRAVKTTPQDPDIYYLRGKILYSLGRYEQAVEPLQHAIELGPTVSLSYYQLGQALEKLGRQREAKEQFERVRFLKAAAP